MEEKEEKEEEEEEESFSQGMMGGYIFLSFCPSVFALLCGTLPRNGGAGGATMDIAE